MAGGRRRLAGRAFAHAGRVQTRVWLLAPMLLWIVGTAARPQDTARVRPPARVVAPVVRDTALLRLRPQITAADTSVRVFARLQPDAISLYFPQNPQAGRTLYRTRPGAISSLSVAPSQQHVAFLERSAPTAAARNALVVLDLAGREVLRDTGSVQRYTWAGSGRIATVAGEPREGGVGFDPLALSLLELGAAGQPLRRIQIEAPAPVYEVEWATFDSALYVETLYPVDGATILRYDPRSNRFEPTRHRDLNFSPSGRFYLNLPDERHPELGVYDARSEREVAIPDSLGVPTRWVYDTGDHLLLARGTKVPTGRTTPSGVSLTRYQVVEHVIYDVARRRVVGRTRGEVLDLVGPGRVVPLRENDRLRLLTRPPPG
ncbi:MAG: hypothetical protein HY704_01320 [Gemmatimonadetes bacterium]|nr:hypothetical protein [Gemmatimonadota bacterium]